MSAKLKIFLSYSRADEDMKTDLDKHLIMLKRQDKIEVWQDREIMAGEEWDSTIKNEIQAAHIILLLISVDFNNSRYIWENELKVAMDRQADGKCRVIPVILRTCEWSEMPYAKLQALPTGGKAVTTFADKDVAYTDIAKGIRNVVNFMTKPTNGFN
mgnify:CR=1 FL=1